jgi:molecular chaperone HtpG
MLLSGDAKVDSSLKELFDNATEFYQENNKKKAGSYFEVKLYGVQSFRNHLMDIKKIHDYLSITAPVPFQPNEFSFSNRIDYFLSQVIEDYDFYSIFLNGEPIFKPYRDSVKLTTKGHDTIKEIKTFEIKGKQDSIAYGWYGIRKNMLGAVARGEMSAGLRIRDGNIQIGDSHLLDGCFRENRFNSYIVGEIHIASKKLVPNSRRDDFIDNETKALFYNAVERDLGLPFTKKIRNISRLKSKSKVSISSPVQENSTTKNNSPLDIISKECKDCPSLQKIIAKLN